MQSNLFGLFSLLCEPRGLNLLDNTGRSSTSETARKRYASTTVHMLHWYQEELIPGSKYDFLECFVQVKICSDHSKVKNQVIL
jgi:hypothetical protein